MGNINDKIEELSEEEIDKRITELSNLNLDTITNEELDKNIAGLSEDQYKDFNTDVDFFHGESRLLCKRYLKKSNPSIREVQKFVYQLKYVYKVPLIFI